MAARIILEAGGIYHIYNHAVGSDNIFKEEENYIFFLGKCSSRLIAFAHILAFCLMPNHFHFVIRIKDRETLLELWNSKINKLKTNYRIKGIRIPPDSDLLDEIITTQFANLFNSYVQSFNKKYFRKGSLLKESFQRKAIETTDALIRTICYVHNNPIEHRFTSKRQDWKFSSYNAIMSEKKTNVLREEVLEVFGGKENFVFMHERCLGTEI